MRHVFSVSRHEYCLMGIFTLLLAVILFVINIISIQLTHSLKKNRTVDSFTSAYYCTLTDDLYGEAEEAFFMSGDPHEKMKKTVSAFLNLGYNYYIAIQQPVEIINQIVPDEFCNYIPRDENGKRLDSSSRANALQVSMNIAEIYDIATESGYWFSETDYIGDDKTEMSVILGNAYHSIYNTGDVFYADYLGKTLRLRVVDFLEEGCSFVEQGEIVCLDWTIVMPAWSFSIENKPSRENENEYFHQTALYLQKLNGTFVLASEDQVPELMAAVANIVDNNDMFDLEFIGYPNSALRLMRQISGEYFSLMVAWSACVTILMGVFFWRIIGYLYDHNRRRIAIMLIAGASYRSVYAWMAAWSLRIVLYANIAAFILTWLFIGTGYQFSTILLCFSLLAGILLIKFKALALSDEKILMAI